MAIVPESRNGKISFYASHLDPWQTNFAAIGLTSAQCTALAAKITAAQDALAEMEAARNASKSATQSLDDAVRALQLYGAPLIQAIKAKAAATNDPAVYTLAQIPAPAIPGPAPAPGTPTDFVVELLGDGSLKLKWKCANPAGTQGTIYNVRRSLTGSAGEFVAIGASGLRQFVDGTVPFGTGAVTYQITAVRSTAMGNPATCNVNFGVGGGGQMVASVVQQPKLAA